MNFTTEVDETLGWLPVNHGQKLLFYNNASTQFELYLSSDLFSHSPTNTAYVKRFTSFSSSISSNSVF